MNQAKALRIPFAGHVPNEVGLERALAAGQRSIEHLDGYIEALERTEAAREGDGASANAATNRVAVRLGAPVRLDFVDETKIARLATMTRETSAAIAPTLHLWRTLFRVADEGALDRLPELTYVTPATLNEWKQEQRESQHHTAPSSQAPRLIALRDRVLKACSDAGVPILLGSDAPQAFNVPGFSAHREMQAMVKAGLTPWQVVESATVGPARFLGLAAESGTVEVGKRADLLLVDGDPLADVANIARISAVMLNGRWLGRAELDSILAGVAHLVRNPPEAPPIDAAEAKAIAGDYELKEANVTLRVEIEKGIPILTARDPRSEKRFRMHRRAAGTYVVREVKAILTFAMQGGPATTLTFAQGDARVEGRRIER